MKNMKCKSFVLFLLAIVLLLSSCSSPQSTYGETATQPATVQTKEDSSHTAEENSYEKILSKHIDKNFEGRSFRIATDNTGLILADNGESLLGKEHYLRNAAIEKKYNIKISLTEESGLPTITDRIMTEALSGSDYCDLILLESTSFQTLAAAKALINVRSIPYLDVNADFYYEKSLSATTLGNISYGIAGDFVFTPDDVNVVFFNKTLLSQAPLPDLYTMVDENQWDMENFLLYSEEVYTLARENGANVHGIISTENQENLLNTFWAGSGMDFMKNDYGTRPELIYYTDDTIKFIEVFRNTFFRSSVYSSSNVNQSSVNSFVNGDSLFLIAPLKNASLIASRGIEWGVLPIPKFDINQKNYYSYTNQCYTLAGFAKGTPDQSFSGIITSAFFATSEDLSEKFAIQNYLNLYFSSPNDARMMQLAIKSPYYDPVEFFGQIDSSFTAATQTLLYRSAANGTNFDALYKQYTKMLDKYLDTIF